MRADDGTLTRMPTNDWKKLLRDEIADARKVRADGLLESIEAELAQLTGELREAQKIVLGQLIDDHGYAGWKRRAVRLPLEASQSAEEAPAPESAAPKAKTPQKGKGGPANGAPAKSPNPAAKTADVTTVIRGAGAKGLTVAALMKTLGGKRVAEALAELHGKVEFLSGRGAGRVVRWKSKAKS